MHSSRNVWKEMNTQIKMKYKYLNSDELQLLENELLQFLIVNGIDGETWKRINQNEPEKAIELVGLFSDLVWQRTLEKVQYGEQIWQNRYMIFEFGSTQIDMYGLLYNKQEKTCNSFQDFLAILKEQPKDIEVFHQTKPYQSTRELELFEMINNGLLLSDQENFNFIKNIYHNA